jgi:hypothetical protein
MKTRFNNEAEFTEYTNGIKNDNSYDRHYVDLVPESYPCIICYESDSDYHGDRFIIAVDIIYPEDFN